MIWGHVKVAPMQVYVFDAQGLAPMTQELVKKPAPGKNTQGAEMLDGFWLRRFRWFRRL